MSLTVADLQQAFGKFDTIPADKVGKLVGILESASSRALLKIYRGRVKFCWAIAARILRERGVELSR